MSDLALDTASAPAPSAAFHGAVRLADWGLIRARGADAASFLQGQLTSDIVGLAPGRAVLAGYCSPKGRLLASFVVWSPAPEEVLLACSADLLAATLKRLSMFVLRAKCRLSDATAELGLWGLAGDAVPGGDAAPWSVLAADTETQTVRLPDVAGVPRALHCQPAAAAAPAAPLLDAAAWRWLEVRSGVVRIVAATVDQFVPQMVNFELVGGVNFKKGCYPGQEVVARSQYRGTLKRRAMLLALPPGAGPALAEGREVFHDADPAQPAGLVALAAHAAGGEQLALVELKLSLAEGPGAFHLGGADGPALKLQPLPYPLPAEGD
ncbi:folate-binding protein [Ideonella sp.]|uniref:CAF17-like 4Fe-4S cluster assembly/insertion protein YgfZ n=1 Tax=Ideonella sp. TaxID=1929293 RepID=UPI002B48363F|nr:folate-binding protein [Ideonella sp.]HJV69098.1 folate-binding protein [Ideonella sp.]